MVDLIDYLENVDQRWAGISILSIMILQSPILTFPGYLLMIYAGFRFGLITGTFVNFVGLYTSCILGHRFGRWSSSDLSRNTNLKVQKFHNLIEEKGTTVLIFLRIFPLIPNNVISIGSGVTKLSEKQHALYSTLSIIQSFFWSFLGSYFLKTNISDLELEITIYHGFVLILLLIFLGYVRYRIISEKENKDILE